MNEAVILKSYHNGIAIRLNPDVPFHAILQGLEQKFTQSKAFFGSSRVAVSLEGRPLSPEEEISILDTINSCSDVKVVCIVGKDEETDKLFVKALRQVDRKQNGTEEGQFYRGSLKNRERLETESSVILLGNVEPGCSVISAGNIIVLGSLYGKAYAGSKGNEKHYIAALEMEPEALAIGDFKYHSNGKKRKKGLFQPKVQPQITFVRDKRIVFEPISKELLDAL